jgi:16S rRNA (adenine1518-N6/adenine1519-N6)-dimethyltransferase
MINARRRFGQHFLEAAWVEKLIRAIDPRPDDVFIEIGSGRGALTRPLAARAKRVVAYEIDRDLAAALGAAGLPNVRVVEGDFLDAAIAVGESAMAPAAALRVAGNLPYNVASPILFQLLHLYAEGVPFADATVMLQREVAERLLASPGTKDYGVLTVLIRHAAAVDPLLKLPPGAFRPPPKVQSSVVRLRFHPPDPPVKDAAIFAGVVNAVFTRRRKTIANALRAYGGRVPGRPALSPAEALARAGIDGSRRPETLAIAEFARLADAFATAERSTPP